MHVSNTKKGKVLYVVTAAPLTFQLVRIIHLHRDVKWAWSGEGRWSVHVLEERETGSHVSFLNMPLFRLPEAIEYIAA